MKRGRLDDTMFEEESDEQRMVVWGQYLDTIVSACTPALQEFLKKKNDLNARFFVRFVSEWKAPQDSGPVKTKETDTAILFELGCNTLAKLQYFWYSFSEDIVKAIIIKMEDKEKTIQHEPVGPTYGPCAFAIRLRISFKEK